MSFRWMTSQPILPDLRQDHRLIVMASHKRESQPGIGTVRKSSFPLTCTSLRGNYHLAVVQWGGLARSFRGPSWSQGLFRRLLPVLTIPFA
jgi:hypothetical protein